MSDARLLAHANLLCCDSAHGRQVWGNEGSEGRVGRGAGAGHTSVVGPGRPTDTVHPTTDTPWDTATNLNELEKAIQSLLQDQDTLQLAQVPPLAVGGLRYRAARV